MAAIQGVRDFLEVLEERLNPISARQGVLSPSSGRPCRR
jgi:hypothetical protein